MFHDVGAKVIVRCFGRPPGRGGHEPGGRVECPRANDEFVRIVGSAPEQRRATLIAKRVLGGWVRRVPAQRCVGLEPDLVGTRRGSRHVMAAKRRHRPQ